MGILQGSAASLEAGTCRRMLAGHTAFYPVFQRSFLEELIGCTVRLAQEPTHGSGQHGNKH